MKARLLFVHALSPLHAGTGQGVGIIDLPIAREKASGIPYLPGSSLKGTLRDECQDPVKRKRVYGPDTNNASEHAGAVQISDQRLVLLPIRSLKGTFAWVTSPYLLRRFVRDVQQTDSSGYPANIPTVATPNCLVSDQDCCIKLSDGKVVLEDLDLTAETNADARAWAVWLGTQIFPDNKDKQSEVEEWRKMLKARICIVSDDALNFLLNTATEVTARIKLKDDTKTVQDGGLWYEEALPTETILSGLVFAIPTRKELDAGNGQKSRVTDEEVFKTVNDSLGKPLQFGGNATVGRGICRVVMTRQNGGQRNANS
jgi:CRISPR-associated protein Cmr4